MNRYTPQDEAQVAGLRTSGLTHQQIAVRTGIPRRSVTAILARVPVAEVVTATTREQVSARLWAVVSEGTEEAIRRIHDPKTKAGELAQIIRVAAEQHALLTGDVTARTATVEESRQPVLNWEQTENLRRYFEQIANASDEDLAANALEIQRTMRLHARVQQLIDAGTPADEAKDTAMQEWADGQEPAS